MNRVDLCRHAADVIDDICKSLNLSRSEVISALYADPVRDTILEVARIMDTVAEE
jgi:hypothetical protein